MDELQAEGARKLRGAGAMSSFRNPLTKYRFRSKRDGPVDTKRCPCQVAINLGRMTDFRQCPNRPKADMVRPVGEEELAVCGSHAGVYDRALAKAEAYDTERSSAKQAMETAEKRAARLSQLAGFTVEVDVRYDRDTLISRPTGQLLINADHLESLVNPDWPRRV